MPFQPTVHRLHWPRITVNGAQHKIVALLKILGVAVFGQLMSFGDDNALSQC